MAGEASALPLTDWLGVVREHVEAELTRVLQVGDEASLDPRWQRAAQLTRDYAIRGGKRLRPALLLAAYGSTRPGEVPRGLWTFAAGIELLHTFMLIHDDIADRAALRRGGPALHTQLASAELGDALGVVVGDHMFARAMEVMLDADLPHRASAVRYYLGVCRHTAAGQYLDLDLSRLPLPQVNLFQTLKVAELKTAGYGFVAPLIAGATLADPQTTSLPVWERFGRNLGLAYQLRDDLDGLFGNTAMSGKAGDGDFYEGKRTYPVVAAYLRSDPATREELTALWMSEHKTPEMAARARAIIEAAGGRKATERVIAHAASAARQAMEALPQNADYRAHLSHILTLGAGQ